jgi:hypothetical protein
MIKFSVIENAQRRINKMDVDGSAPETVMISADAPARIRPDVAAPVISELCQRIQDENTLQLRPFRLILLSANLNEATNFWEQELGLPQVGVSNQAEGVAVGRNLSWGSTEESARSIIILTDTMAAAAMAGNALAVTTLAHELGHVHDEFARGVAVGFPKSRVPPDARNWPKVCDYIANMVWGEYAAESIGTRYMGREDLRDCMLNDPVHVAGVHDRLRQSVWNYKCRGQDLVSLWSGSITAIGDIFANLGRATARLQFVENSQEALARLVSLPKEAALWKPVIERLDRELQLLAAKHYSDWGAEPFRGIQETVALGFEAVGLYPTHDGNNLHVRVP